MLIYFAGHGFMYQGKGYLAPYDIDPTDIAATGYPMDELGAVIGGKIHAKSKDPADRRLPQRRHHSRGYRAA